MATQTVSEAADKSRLSKLALPGAIAAASAGIGLLLTIKPKRLRGAIAKLPGGAQDLVGDLKERVESVGGASTPQAGRESQGSRGQPDELEARRRERKERREQRRQQATS
jgi:hypothetical protein